MSERRKSKLPPVVVKVGGALLQEPTEALWQGIQRVREDAPVVLVHGGGAQATALAERLGHTPRMVRGRRVTEDLDLQISQYALRGALNTELVAQAQQHDLRGVGLSGADGGLVRVTKRPPREIGGETVDFGWVGDVGRVEPEALAVLLDSGFLPIVAPLGIDADGQVYNVNADTVAGALAGALGAKQLLLVTEAGSVRRAEDDPGSRLETCDAATFEAGKEGGWIQGGMRVKLTVALDALRGGVTETFVLGPGDLVERERATRVVLEA
ncbi:MAG: acetylglutamate kinase [Bacteroidetes bacterium QS_8_64_10]|nr:MAG: acetylglutamate kinase [Bacteroidetes bacterium QS_8_64_10]